MNKISGILPSTARVTAVDMKSAQPIRPGQPDFGRPVGRSGEAAKITPKVAGRNPLATHRDVMSIRNKEERHKAIVEEMSNSFFMKNRQSAPAQVVDSDFRATSFQQDVFAPEEGRVPAYQESATPVSLEPMMASSDMTSEEALDLPSVGAQLDVVA